MGSNSSGVSVMVMPLEPLNWCECSARVLLLLLWRFQGVGIDDVKRLQARVFLVIGSACVLAPNTL